MQAIPAHGTSAVGFSSVHPKPCLFCQVRMRILPGILVWFFASRILARLCSCCPDSKAATTTFRGMINHPQTSKTFLIFMFMNNRRTVVLFFFFFYPSRHRAPSFLAVDNVKVSRILLTRAVVSSIEKTVIAQLWPSATLTLEG